MFIWRFLSAYCRYCQASPCTTWLCAQSAKVRQIVDAISETDHDQQIVMQLAEQGTVLPWAASAPGELAEPVPLPEDGVVWITDRQIVDLRNAGRVPASQDSSRPQPSGSTSSQLGTVYIRRRIRFCLTKDFDLQAMFSLPFTVRAKDCDVRCPTVELHPQVHRMRAPASNVESHWLLQLNLTEVAIDQPVDVILEAMYPATLDATFQRDPLITVNCDFPVRELTFWMLLPTDANYDGYRIVELPAEHTAPGREIFPSEGLTSASGNIMHWSLLGPTPQARYQCHWRTAASRAATGDK